MNKTTGSVTGGREIETLIGIIGPLRDMIDQILEREVAQDHAHHTASHHMHTHTHTVAY